MQQLSSLLAWACLVTQRPAREEVLYADGVTPQRDDSVPRLSRALLRRAESWETFPLAALSAQCELQHSVAELERRAVMKARELGASWTDIADALGVSRQAVQQRYGHHNGNGHGDDSPNR